MAKKTYLSLERLTSYTAKVKELLAGKVDKVEGKGLSTNDFTNAYKTKLDGLANTVINDTLTSTSVTEALSANQGKVLKGLVDVNIADIDTLEGKVAALEAGTYDDTEVRGLISANTEAINGVKADYLKAADKTELSNAIAAEKERAEGVEGGLEDRIETMEAFWEAAKADGTDSNVIDTLKEIQEYIASDETGASEMAASIKQNADDIDAVEGRVGTLEGTVAGLHNYDDTEVRGLISANAADIVEINTELGKKALATDLTALQNTVSANETDIEGKVSALTETVNGKVNEADLVEITEAEIEALFA